MTDAVESAALVMADLLLSVPPDDRVAVILHCAERLTAGKELDPFWHLVAAGLDTHGLVSARARVEAGEPTLLTQYNLSVVQNQLFGIGTLIREVEFQRRWACFKRELSDTRFVTHRNTGITHHVVGPEVANGGFRIRAACALLLFADGYKRSDTVSGRLCVRCAERGPAERARERLGLNGP